jgi:hypothetical protein
MRLASDEVELNHGQDQLADRFGLRKRVCLLLCVGLDI